MKEILPKLGFEGNSCGFMIRQLHLLLDKKANEQLKKDNLTIAQLSFLFVLEETFNGSATLKQMEKELQLAQSTTVGLASRLQEKDLVDIFAHSNDARVKVVSIKPAGKKLTEHACEEMNAVEARLLRSLTSDEQKYFRSLLSKIYKDFSLDNEEHEIK